MSDKPKCGKPGCEENCWADGRPDEPCWGRLRVSEDDPGAYTHYCDGHGHPEDGEPYRPEPKAEA